MTDNTIWRSGKKTDNDPKKQYTENYGEKQENLELMYESKAVPVQLVAPIVLQLLQTRG